MYSTVTASFSSGGVRVTRHHAVVQNNLGAAPRAKPALNLSMITHAILLRADSVATNAAIAAFSSDPMFIEFAARETQETLDRDREDVTKLTQGIRRAVARGVLTPDPPVEALTIIDVLGASVDTIVERILTWHGHRTVTHATICLCLCGMGSACWVGWRRVYPLLR